MPLSRTAVLTPMCIGAWVLSLSLGSAIASAQLELATSQPIFPEPDGASAEETPFEPAQDVADALARATAAIREAEKGGPDARDKTREADHYVQEAIKLDPGNLKAEFIAGRLNRLIGRSRDAFSQVQNYVNNSPAGSVDWEGYKVLADLFREGNYYVQAAAKYAQAAKLAPNESSIFVGWSQCNLRQGKKKEAIELAKEAVRLQPDSADTNQMLAEALLADNQLPEAKQAILRALDRNRLELREDPGSMAVLQKLRQQYQALQSVALNMIKTDPSSGGLYLELADATVAYNDVTRAMSMHELWRRFQDGILATQPKTPPAMIEKYAELSAVIRKHEAGAEFLEDYLEKNPLDEAARAALDKLRAEAQVQAAAPR